MNIAKGPVSRPILTTIIFMIVIIIGLVSFSRLSIDLMPEITRPQISVGTSYANVGPQEIEESITRPIEEALAAVQGVEEITSTSTEGMSQVQLSFEWGKDLEEATNDIRDRLDRVIGRLPEDITRPMIRKFDLAAFPIMNIGVSSNLNPIDLRQIIDDQVKYRLERVPGVASIDVWGGLNREIHVNLNADKLKALGIAPSTVLTALNQENRNIPAGLYEKGNLDVLVRTQGEYQDLEEIRRTVITTRNGAPIQIQDVALVEDAWEEIRQLIRIDGKPGLRIAVSKQSGANTVNVAERVLAEMAQINLDIPQVRLIPIMDTSKYIKESINNVGNAIIIGGFLAVIVLFLFLRNVSSTLIISTAIPISIIATFALMYFGGFTLNIITFGGLALGIGMLVDNAIVVIENIYRHRENGMMPIESALVGTSEVWSAILASTLTTLVVFFPVVFIRGMSGITFKQMAFVVSFSLLCSLVVALTLIPMLSSKFLHLRSSDQNDRNDFIQKIYDQSEILFNRIEDQYAVLLEWALSRRKTVIIIAAGLLIVSVVLIPLIGVELMPAADESEVRISLEMAVGTRLEIMDQTSRTVEGIVQKNVPEMVSMLTRVGGSGHGPRRSGGGNSADVELMLVPRGERKRSSEKIANDLRKLLQGLPGVEVRTRAGQGLFILRIGSGGSSDNITVEIRGYDLKIAHELAERTAAIINTVPGITDTRISREEGSPEQIIRIDRQKAADLGLNVSRIGDALRTAIGGTQASYFREGGKQYDILVRLREQHRTQLDTLLDLSVINSRGESVVLKNVVNVLYQEGPVRIERKDQERVIRIRGNFTGRDMGSVIRDIRMALQAVPVPKDFSIVFGGDYEEQQEAFNELLIGLILAILMVYMVMAGQFESFRDPLVVLFAIPMGTIGIVVTMIFTNTIFSMQSFIGCIMLAGIVVNNAILLVDYTNQLRRKQNLSLMEAIKLGGARRLRPILMTTLTTVLGLLPLSFGFGEGGEAQAPLARVVIGGLLSSTLITLVLVPVIYSIFEKEMTAHQTESGDLTHIKANLKRS